MRLVHLNCFNLISFFLFKLQKTCIVQPFCKGFDTINLQLFVVTLLLVILCYIFFKRGFQLFDKLRQQSTQVQRVELIAVGQKELAFNSRVICKMDIFIYKYHQLVQIRFSLLLIEVWRLTKKFDQETFYGESKFRIIRGIVRKHLRYKVRIGWWIRWHLSWKIHIRIQKLLRSVLLNFWFFCKNLIFVERRVNILKFLFATSFGNFPLLGFDLLFLRHINNFFFLSGLTTLGVSFNFFSRRVQVNVILLHFYQFIVVGTS